MTNKYDSYYKKFANQVLDWLPMDTKERYDKNLKENYTELESNGWINNHFTYKFNSQGFRSQEFTNDPTIMCLGCSFTCGIGLPIEHIWPELLAKQLNMQCANLGIGGSSMDTAFRLISEYIDKINPAIVICLKPIMFRFEIVGNDNIFQILPNQVPRNIESFYAMWTQNNFNAELNSEKNLLAMQMLCQSRNIKFLSYELADLIGTGHNRQLARDLQHFGAIYHTNFANKILANI